MPFIDIELTAVNDDSFSIGVGLGKIVTRKKTEYYQIRIVLQAVLLEHDELFAGMCAGVPGIYYINLVETVASLKVVLK